MFRDSSNVTRQQRTLHPHRFLVLLAAVLVVFQTGALANAASTTTTQPTKSIKPDYKFFYGKTITIVINNGPATQIGLITAAIQPAWEHYLHATINIDAVPTAPDAASENSVMQATPDGLTVGFIGFQSPLIAVYTNSGLSNIPMSQASWIGGVGTAPIVVVVPRLGRQRY